MTIHCISILHESVSPPHLKAPSKLVPITNSDKHGNDAVSNMITSNLLKETFQSKHPEDQEEEVTCSR